MSRSGGRSAVVFDRDGVLIESPVIGDGPVAIRDPADLEFTPDAHAVCAELRDAGLPLFVFTNQPDVARGKTTREAVDAINDAVAAELGITEVACCYLDGDETPCRKPNPGMLLDLAAAHDLDLSRTVVVGDRWRDIEAGDRAGTHTVFINRNYGERQPTTAGLTVTELGESTAWILQQTR